MVPIDYRLNKEALFAAMDKVNGLYIPGDGRTTLLDKEFMQTINFLL